MSKSCRPQLDRLIACVGASPCCTRDKQDIKTCLKLMSASASHNDPAEGSGSASMAASATQQQQQQLKEFEKCTNLRIAYFNCKRGQVDMRTRIRGNRQA
ncbi:hypothetical protein PPROV_000778700 [Pycnococcus provasolii]|uniref:Uncharacterized protein n=1 Tax=Pycnococcus provasolii TaxID=41880 RepID=A0A830HTI7_9CHLO|nr:hypothetical protein PPROV_000778700 [Pycnococcus provasolii]|mmetsp:Transcript_5602/g.12597  ORF Transcript_5602/g.12597 Transcript_5602/m.12597 type:complete len:100 (-) Transcript_5602:66-365(-)